MSKEHGSHVFRRPGLEFLSRAVIPALAARASASVGIMLGTALCPAASAQAQPVTLVDSGVSLTARFQPSRFDPTHYWYTRPACTNSPAITSGNPRGIPGEELLPATISRASTSVPFVRVLFEFNPPRPVGVCNSHVMFSDIVTDANFLYYVDNQGPDGRAAIWRRSKDANVEDASELLVDLPYVLSSAELLVFDNTLLALLHGPMIADGIIRYDKTTGAITDQNFAFDLSNSMRNMQTDGRFVYWIGNGGLRRHDLTNGNEILLIPGISTYLADEYFVDCTPKGCEELAFTLYAKDNQVFYDETFTGVINDPAFYTSDDPNADIVGVTRGFGHFFFFERRITGGGFGQTENRIYRWQFNTVGSDLIYGPIQTDGPGWDSLTSDWTWLYFRDQAAESFLRLPNDAAAIPIQDLAATRIEITQALQNAGNGKRLLENKATTVRVYVESQNAASVPGVTAILSGSTASAGFLGTLRPVASSNLITVVAEPDRDQLNQSFLFELPRHWTTQGPITLVATVNPERTIVENDLADNSISFGPIAFSPSARLHVAYYNFWFPFGTAINRTTDAELAASQHYMRHIYPIGEPGNTFESAGLHFTVHNIYDADLTSRVLRTNTTCTDTYPDAADRNLCASDYVHSRLQEMRQEGWISADTLSYANIASGTCAGGNPCPFTRGYGTMNVGSGPANDEDYAAHEVGHLLGRLHPVPGAAACGHSASDPDYPNQDGDIEQNFLPEDIRAAGLRRDGTTYTFLDGDSTGDIMAYCDPPWISEYTSEGMYDFMAARNPQLQGSSDRTSLVGGDWLVASGVLNPGDNSGGFVRVRRMSSVADDTAPEPGDFRLEILDALGSPLATHHFSGQAIDDRPGEIRFDLVVPFEEGTASLRIKKIAGGQILATTEISDNAPVVTNVALIGAPDPVDGAVALAWDADDDDGDDLTFDILATRDGGATFRPILLGLTSTATNLDTTLLGGGSNQLRVVATDGVLTGSADSDPLEVVARAPTPLITEPANGSRVVWGQVVTLSAEISDLQDDFIFDESIVWTNQYGEIGTGRVVQSDQLQVGENVITVTATNSLGQSGTASVTITVADEFVPPGPRIAAAPTLLAWHVSSGVTEIQADLLQVNNSGGGSLTFDIISDSDWVTIDNASGLADVDAPASLIVRADPAAVAPATTGFAILTMQNTSDPADIVEVTVQLARGNTFDGPPTICDPETGECIIGGDCGNAIIEVGETCDDGGFAPGDICGADCEFVGCGDPNDSGSTTAADALFVLKAAVGSETCAPCVCNADGAGEAISASDALRVLRAAVGLAGQLSCVPCTL